MSFDQHENFSYGVVTVAPSPAASGTTLSVSNSDADSFPDPSNGEYNCTVWPSGSNPIPSNAEIVRVTAKGSADSGGAGETEFTIARTQEDTSARSIVVGDQFAMTHTEKTQEDVETTLSYGSLSRQLIINGNFDIWQRGTSFTAASSPANNDDTYLADRWILLSDGNDVVDVSQETSDIPAGSRYSLKSLVATANKKWGFLQIIEAREAIKFRGKTVSLSFQAHTTSGQIENLRASVLSWDGTADAVTSDVVSAWNAEGSNPTFATNWTAENTASNLVLSNSYQKFEIENISVDTSGMNNLAVFIWVDDTDGALNDELFISQVQLNEGSFSLPFGILDIHSEWRACLRYYEKGFYGGHRGGELGVVTPVRDSSAGNKQLVASVEFMVVKRTNPTITFSDNTKSFAFEQSSNTDRWATPTVNTIVNDRDKHFACYIQDNTNFSTGELISFGFQWYADAEL